LPHSIQALLLYRVARISKHDEDWLVICLR
jgi:hypothetical protein